CDDGPSFILMLFAKTVNSVEGNILYNSCILPCSFQSGEGVVIHWIQMTTSNNPVHVYRNKDQFTHQHQHFRALQDQRFKNRTSLFQDQISGGNASLQLSGVRIQDQGRYQCTTMDGMRNTQPSVFAAPVDKVDIQQVENRITCSSEGIYPQPELTWSTSPPSNVSLENNPTVQQTEQLLYNINSSLIASVTDLVYSCTVSTRTNKRTATLSSIQASSCTIFCILYSQCYYTVSTCIFMFYVYYVI
uniref:Ig-like domain-containing protein n=1 Tax=Sander lucioperca TaxID=283035 RepID=A0A8D0AWT0_SANLU